MKNIKCKKTKTLYDSIYRRDIWFYIATITRFLISIVMVVGVVGFVIFMLFGLINPKFYLQDDPNTSIPWQGDITPITNPNNIELTIDGVPYSRVDWSTYPKEDYKEVVNVPQKIVVEQKEVNIEQQVSPQFDFTLTPQDIPRRSELELTTLQKLNTYRVENGLDECKPLNLLRYSSYEKAMWIYQNKSFGHNMMYNDVVYMHSIITRAWGLNTRYSSENLVMSVESDDLIDDWKSSKSHNEAMLENDLIYCDIAIMYLPDYGNGMYVGVLHMGVGDVTMPQLHNTQQCTDIIQCKKDNIKTYTYTYTGSGIGTDAYSKYINAPLYNGTIYYDR